MKKDRLIRKYDRHVKRYEHIQDNPRLSRWRRKLLQHGKGNVLEVGIGAGANFSHYNKENVHITGVDFSPEMLKAAKKNAASRGIHAELIQSDVEQLHLEDHSFDYIVSTLTLCSYTNPQAILNNFNQWCREDGTILLLEHGLSKNLILSTFQKVVNPIHKMVSGCHCHRDMMALLESSKLQVEHVERHWAGIFCLIWAKPNKEG